MGAGIGPNMHRRPPEAYNEYMKAYSVAMLPGKERVNLSYGGKSTSSYYRHTKHSRILAANIKS